MRTYTTPLDRMIITRAMAITELDDGVYDTGVPFSTADFDYHTHDLPAVERRHVMLRNEWILRSLVLTLRPDLGDVEDSVGKGLEDLVEWHVADLDRRSALFTGPGCGFHDVYRGIAQHIIGELDKVSAR